MRRKLKSEISSQWKHNKKLHPQGDEVFGHGEEEVTNAQCPNLALREQKGGNKRAFLPFFFKGLYLETDNISFLNYFCIGQSTPEMQIILHQIVNYPFHGLIKEIYLQAKSLELMALKLEPDTAGERELMRSRILRTDDINQIYHAREILIRDFDNPPSLLELARQVALNDYKLKIRFRQVFNTTVFGYLYAHRMEKARKLLMSQQMTIKQIAKIVGYECLSRFGVAFKKHFGIQPSQYLDRFIVAKNT